MRGLDALITRPEPNHNIHTIGVFERHAGLRLFPSRAGAGEKDHKPLPIAPLRRENLNYAPQCLLPLSLDADKGPPSSTLGSQPTRLPSLGKKGSVELKPEHPEFTSFLETDPFQQGFG